MRRSVSAVLLVVLMVAAGCGDDDESTTDTTATKKKPASTAETVTVGVDGKADDFAAFFIAYFPNEVTVHPGDTVAFESRFTGEPHSVVLGTLTDAGLAALDKLGPEAEEEPAELKKLPVMLPDGPGDAVQTTAAACFLASGDPPTDGAACPKAEQPEFDGTQSVYSSGFLPEGETFTVPLAKDIAPGTYSYFCALHRSSMRGKITVVAPSAKADTAAEVQARGDAGLAVLVSKLAPVATKMTSLTADTAQAGGSAGPEVSEAAVAEFGPKDLSIPTGGTVTWDVQGPHTISFNPSEDVRLFIGKDPDGGVHLVPAAFAPAGGPGAPEGPPSEKPSVIDGGTWDGVGFRNSGVLLGFGPPGFLRFKMKFAKAGSYSYACLIHPDMEGTVKVG